MNRREILAAAGFGTVLTLPQLYPEGVAAAVARADEEAERGEAPGTYGEVVPSKMEYLVVDSRTARDEGMDIGYLLTFLAADRGYEVIAVTVDPHHGAREYLMARRRPLGPDVAAMTRHLARKHAEDAISGLRDIAANGRDEKARALAAKALLDHGFGTPGGAS